MKKDFNTRYSGKELMTYDEPALVAALKALPCCVTDKKDKKTGDPLNLIVIGELEELLEAFAAAKWDETESLGVGSGYQMSKSFLFRHANRYAPVSPLYYNGVSQDIAFQKARERIDQRLHLRLWYSPMRFNGKPVWVGTVSRDIGVRFTFKTWYLTTHKIDSHIDEARDYVLEDLSGVERVSHYGFVEGVGARPRSKPGRNLTGDPFYTDGLRVTIELGDTVTSLSSFNWTFPAQDTQ